MIKIVRIQSRICIGGPALHTEILTTYLPGERYQTILVGGQLQEHEQDLFRSLREKKLDVRLLPEMKRDLSLSDDLQAIWKLICLIKKEKPQIVHTHTAKAGTLGRIAALICGVPVVVHTFHGHVFYGYFSPLKTRLFILVERVLSLMSDQIIAISESQAADLVQKYKVVSSKKVSVIRLGFHLQRYQSDRSPWLKKQLGIGTDSALAAVIGRLVPIKNLPMAIGAIKLLVDRGRDVHLCIVGDGDEHERLNRLVQESELQDRVHFMGWITEINRVYCGIDMLLQSSLNEGTPISILEAMAAKVPVISTPVGGVPDLIQEGISGFLCETDNPHDMARQIDFVLQNPRIVGTVTANAKEFVLKNYDYSRLIGDIDSLYQKLALLKLPTEFSC
ncbi:MAG TPA: glycosyltransferase [bacterium]|nr:glycosyltransferase [bacterium]HPG46692.1 glycosyltransferase [bacterium]HPM98776.1 glycosyltransferase [bacterium]